MTPGRWAFLPGIAVALVAASGSLSAQGIDAISFPIDGMIDVTSARAVSNSAPGSVAAYGRVTSDAPLGRESVMAALGLTEFSSEAAARREFDDGRAAWQRQASSDDDAEYSPLSGVGRQAGYFRDLPGGGDAPRLSSGALRGRWIFTVEVDVYNRALEPRGRALMERLLREIDARLGGGAGVAPPAPSSTPAPTGSTSGRVAPPRPPRSGLADSAAGLTGLISVILIAGGVAAGTANTFAAAAAGAMQSTADAAAQDVADAAARDEDLIYDGEPLYRNENGEYWDPAREEWVDRAGAERIIQELADERAAREREIQSSLEDQQRRADEDWDRLRDRLRTEERIARGELTAENAPASLRDEHPELWERLQDEAALGTMTDEFQRRSESARRWMEENRPEMLDTLDRLENDVYGRTGVTPEALDELREMNGAIITWAQGRAEQTAIGAENEAWWLDLGESATIQGGKTIAVLVVPGVGAVAAAGGFGAVIESWSHNDGFARAAENVVVSTLFDGLGGVADGGGLLEDVASGMLTNSAETAIRTRGDANATAVQAGLGGFFGAAGNLGGRVARGEWDDLRRDLTFGDRTPQSPGPDAPGAGRAADLGAQPSDVASPPPGRPPASAAGSDVEFTDPHTGLHRNEVATTRSSATLKARALPPGARHPPQTTRTSSSPTLIAGCIKTRSPTARSSATPTPRRLPQSVFRPPTRTRISSSSTPTPACIATRSVTTRSSAMPKDPTPVGRRPRTRAPASPPMRRSAQAMSRPSPRRPPAASPPPKALARRARTPSVSPMLRPRDHRGRARRPSLPPGRRPPGRSPPLGMKSTPTPTAACTTSTATISRRWMPRARCETCAASPFRSCWSATRTVSSKGSGTATETASS